MALRFLQTNINHCSAAHELLRQSLAQWLISAAIVCEPYCVLDSQGWLGDVDGKVALISRCVVDSPPLELVARGQGYVAARLGDLLLVGVYLSPRFHVPDLEQALTRLTPLVLQNISQHLIVAGDFNAKSDAWGSPVTDPKGRALQRWVAAMGLQILNRGSVQTCVRQQGGSVIDLTFGSPRTAARVSAWRVLEGVETLSDHRYIRYSVSAHTSGSRPTNPAEDGPRWALKRLDREMAEEAALVQAWVSPPESPVDVDQEAASFREALTHVCDASMPRAGPTPPRRAMYWWSADIALLRRACVAARRRYQRHRRRRRRRADDAMREAELYGTYRVAKKALSKAIAVAKATAREEFLRTLDDDPWGRPYRMVRQKMRPYAPPLTKTLDLGLLTRIVETLFPAVAPSAAAAPRVPLFQPDHIGEDIAVTAVELRLAVRRMCAKNTAPGLDGVPGRVLALALRALGPRLLALLSACMERGQFPRLWKTGRLVLLHKEGRPADSPSAYRPIVLLDEVCKVFERVIAARLARHLGTDGPDLAPNQFGFRRGHSTVHAILRVRAQAEAAVARGEVMLAVSLDIANAFNSLPWSAIREALVFHQVPLYLRRVLHSYLSDRSVVYPTRTSTGSYRMACGVPQGSVLGPILWNLGYDRVLRGANLRGVDVTCYADDTLVTARGENLREATILATAGVAHVVARIRGLGLRVALSKSEALLFHGPRRAPPSGAHIIVGGERIDLGVNMSYLGLTLDGRWTFDAHFERLAPRLVRAASALGSLLPNLGGPSASCRRLFLGVIRSMALYGAPVWAGALTSRSNVILRRAQRTLAVRAIRGYRTVSCDAACVLAGSVPWDLDARALASLFQWREEAHDRGDRPALREVDGRRLELRQASLGNWALRLQGRSAAHWTIRAVLPILQEWVDRQHGRLTFRLTQVLTGHGCFGEYLCQMARREESCRCHHCTSSIDTAEHTLTECPAWDSERADLVAVVGGDLSLPTVVRTMVQNEAAWSAMLRFCEAVMATKEAAERERELNSLNPARTRRTRGRRRQNDLMPP